MKPPSSTAGTVAAAIGILAAGAAAGAFAANTAVKGKGDPLTGTILTIEAGVWGVMAAGFGGLILAAMSKGWRPVGETAALVGVGAPLVLGAIGLTKATIAQAETPAVLPPGPETYQVDVDDNGQNFTLNVGDTLNVVLDANMPVPTVTPTGLLTSGTSTTAPAVAAVAASGSTPATAATDSMVTYPFTATAAGTATLTSNGTATTSTDTTDTATPPTSFSMTITISTPAATAV